MNSLAQNFRVILVEPGDSLNIGQVARAMGNLGFGSPVLVAPRNYNRERAAITACQAELLLDTITFHETLDDALADCEETVAFSMSKGWTQANFVTLPEWTRELPPRLHRKTALIFGPEESGLRQEHLECCRWIVSIPSAPECPSFNLAQSVLLVLWELSKFAPPAAPPEPSERLPTGNDFVQIDRLLDRIMVETGFLRTGTPAPVPALVRNLFRRLPLNSHEMGVLLGLLGRVDRTLARRDTTPSPDTETVP